MSPRTLTKRTINLFPTRELDTVFQLINQYSSNDPKLFNILNKLATTARQSIENSSLLRNEIQTLASQWVDIPYSASYFDGNGTMTWTVDSGDLSSFKHFVFQDICFFVLRILTSSVGGVVSNQLRATVPFSSTADTDGANGYQDNGTSGIGRYAIVKGTSKLLFLKNDDSNWTLSTNNSRILASGFFPVG